MYTPIWMSAPDILSLRTEGYAPGAYILYCLNCPFQYPPDTYGPSRCPDCNTTLHIAGPVSDVQKFQTDPIYRAQCLAKR